MPKCGKVENAYFHCHVFVLPWVCWVNSALLCRVLFVSCASTQLAIPAAVVASSLREERLLVQWFLVHLHTSAGKVFGCCGLVATLPCCFTSQPMHHQFYSVSFGFLPLLPVVLLLSLLMSVCIQSSSVDPKWLSKPHLQAIRCNDVCCFILYMVAFGSFRNYQWRICSLLCQRSKKGQVWLLW